MPSTVTLAELLVPQSIDEIRANLLASLQGVEFPTTDWEPLGPERSIVEMEATALEDLSAGAQPAIVAGGFNDYATGDWLTLYADQTYDNQRGDPTRTIGNILFTNVSGTTYPLVAGKIVAIAASGLRYLSTTTVSLGPSSSMYVVMQSEFTNDSKAGRNYNDAANSIQTLLTPLPGVSINNPAPTFSLITHIGSGTGTLTLAPTDLIANNVVVGTSIKVTIQSSGDIGAGSLKYNVNGGADIVVTPIPATIVVAGKDITITTVNGTTPSFIVGDTYSFETPGTWYTQQGIDAESDLLLRQRDRNKWATLSLVPTDGLYSVWARLADPSVQKVTVNVDLSVANQVNIRIAGPAGPVSTATRDAVQAYIDPRKPLTDRPVVASAAALAITLSGATVQVQTAKLAAAQKKAQQNVQDYINAAPIGGYVIPPAAGKIFWSAVNTAIDEVDGVVNISGLSLNGGGLGVDVTLSAIQVATFAQNLATAITWVPV